MEAADPPEMSGLEILTRGLAGLAQRYGRPVPVNIGGSEERLTPEQARSLVADLERQLEAGVI